MKKSLFIALLFCMPFVVIKAQTFTDDFESNSLGWTEEFNKRGEAVIKDGAFYLTGKSDSRLLTHCFAGYDVKQDFKISCDINVKKITDENLVGLVFDYMDDYNFKSFLIDEEYAYYNEYEKGELVGYAVNIIKLKEKRKTDIKLEIISTFNKIQFICNGVTALELRYKDLISSGIGLITVGEQKAIFDNLKIE